MQRSLATFLDAVASFVADARQTAPPLLTMNQTKRILFDGVASMVYGSLPRFSIGQKLGSYIDLHQGGTGAHVVGRREEVDPQTAALVNGTLAYACDTESFHAGSITHPFAAVGPAALAAAELTRSNGVDFLTSIAVGVDVACRMSLTLGVDAMYARAFHPSAIGGTFGATAAVCVLLDLDRHHIRNAFGLAATSASGLMSWVGDPNEHTRPFNLGLAARNGVASAELASAGLSGPVDAFEGQFPIWQAFSGVWKPQEGLDGLGDRYLIDDNRFKFYACCGFLHPGLDGLIGIMRSESLDPTDLAKITLRFPASGANVIDDNPLRSHCAQYVLAVAAVRGRVDYEEILVDQRSIPEIQRIAQVIEVHSDELLDEFFPQEYRSVVIVKCRDGRIFERTIGSPKGSVENPATDEELKQKVSSMLDDSSRIQTNDLWDTAWSLGDSSDIGGLIRLMTDATQLDGISEH